MEIKKYSAFVSSNFESLRTERNIVINCLLDSQLIPICMEHFTATSSENFGYIKSLINQSDIFIMILGDIYGSCDAKGISWTENEYNYAQQTNKICYVLKTKEYVVLKQRYDNGEQLNDNQIKQINFGERISYAQTITEERPIQRIIQQIISGTNFSNCEGWIRREKDSEQAWQKKNRYLDLRGKWYHVHLKEDDSNYMRAGSVTVKQEFTSDQFRHLHFSANNYNVSGYNEEKKTLILDKLKKTVWAGDYILKEDGMILGVYEAERYFKGNYGEWEIKRGVYRGVHKFNIVDEDLDEDTTDQTVMLSGTFNDVSPSPKMGLIYLFRSKEDRYNFLLDNFENVLRSKL